MQLLHFIQSLLGGETPDNRKTNQMVSRGQLPQNQQEIYPQRPQPQRRTREQIAQAPFKMFEDNSFQGDPRQYLAQHPGYKFFEDNTFAEPNHIYQNFNNLPGLQMGGDQLQQGLVPDTIDSLPADWSQGGVQSFNPGQTQLQNSGFGSGGNPQHSAFINPQSIPNQRLRVIQQAYRRLR